MMVNIFKVFCEKIQPNANNNFNLKLCHGFYDVKNLQSLTKKSKTLKTCYIMTWHVNPQHITLGPHNIYVNFFKL